MTTQDAAFEECYRAVHSRDRRFDGQFVTAAHSTTPPSGALGRTTASTTRRVPATSTTTTTSLTVTKGDHS